MKTHRRNQGTILPLVAAIAMIFITVLATICAFGLYMLTNQVITEASEAASLSAASDIGTIVILDPHFGFVALTDWPAGKATINEAGEPMPVIGMNTIMATCRFNLLVAKRLGNAEMLGLAIRDSARARDTGERLMLACRQALGEATKKPLDRDGCEVNAYARARAAFFRNVPQALGAQQLKRFELTLGCASDTSSMTPVARPVSMAEVTAAGVVGNSYKACVNVPVDHEEYYFAALGQTTSLISRKNFHQPNDKRICSVLKVSAEFESADGATNNCNAKGSHTGWTVAAVACAVAGVNSDLLPGAVMTISYPHGLVPGLCSISDLLNNYELDCSHLQLLRSSHGDYPNDPGSLLIDDTDSAGPLTAGQLVAKGLYDWLRTCHGRLRIDSVMSTVSAPFSSAQPIQSALFAYSPGDNGTIRIALDKNYSMQRVLDEQNYAVSYDLPNGGKNWTFIWRDEVGKLGPEGGKHAGRPLLDLEVEELVEHVYPHNGLAVAMEFSVPH